MSSKRKNRKNSPIMSRRKKQKKSAVPRSLSRLPFLNVVLRVDRVFIGNTMPPETITTATSSSAPDYTQGSLCLIEAPLVELAIYAGARGVHWLLRIAHCICNPSTRSGTLYSFEGPDPASYLHTPFDSTVEYWKPIGPDDALKATVYKYRLPPGHQFRLTKISEVRGHSGAPTSSTAGSMRENVFLRDNCCCWVTNDIYEPEILVNSHVVPKRTGDAMSRSIYQDFVQGPLPPGTIGSYNPVFGISLSASFDKLFDNYHLSFWFENAACLALFLSASLG